MYIEMTRGRSDIYDVLTHLTFMYIEAEKIRRNSEDHRGRKNRDWKMLEEIDMDAFEGLIAGSNYLQTWQFIEANIFSLK